MRIHLGHHFYGAGNLGDDFMLAGFLAAMRTLAPDARFTCSTPFPLEPQRRRFPAIDWLPYDDAARSAAIADCDVWLGLGGSPFQSEQSRWFLDHLTADAARCTDAGKPMFFLGVGVQQAAELHDPALRQLCATARGIWTRDPASAGRLRSLPHCAPVAIGADLAHILFRDTPPAPAGPGRVTLVPNFDFARWPGQAACLDALRQLPATGFVWLAQESRDLPGAERALHAALPAAEMSRWQLTSPEQPGAPLSAVLARWPSGEWLVTSRYHAALAGAWSGSNTVIIATNDKLAASAVALAAPSIPPSADAPSVTRALAAARPVPRAHLTALADQAFAASADFVRSAVAHLR